MFARALAYPGTSLRLAASACFGLALFGSKGLDDVLVTAAVVAAIVLLVPYRHFRRTGQLIGEAGIRRRAERRSDKWMAHRSSG